MQVLIISSNTLPAAPSGPVYVAGAARQAGHTVKIYDRLFAVDVAGELTAEQAAYQQRRAWFSLDRLQLEEPGLSRASVCPNFVFYCGRGAPAGARASRLCALK